MEATFILAEHREEDEMCEAGTEGCCVDHTAAPEYPECAAW